MQQLIEYDVYKTINKGELMKEYKSKAREFTYLAYLILIFGVLTVIGIYYKEPAGIPYIIGGIVLFLK